MRVVESCDDGFYLVRFIFSGVVGGRRVFSRQREGSCGAGSIVQRRRRNGTRAGATIIRDMFLYVTFALPWRQTERRANGGYRKSCAALCFSKLIRRVLMDAMRWPIRA